jgi:proteasome lid subunit RPN8/RPN11
MIRKQRLPTRSRKVRLRSRQRRPPLRLTPYAWAKLLFLRDLGQTEVGAFGVSSPHDLLLVEDVHLVRQSCTPVTVKFDDQSVADYFDAQVDRGRKPEQFARLWIHTHPGDSPYPSCTDEDTFQRCFGSTQWAIMLIVARGGQAYARLRISAGPGGELILPVEVDFQKAFPAADPAAWEAEYGQFVSVEPERPRKPQFAPRFDDIRLWPDDESTAFGDAWFGSISFDSPWEPIDEPFR